MEGKMSSIHELLKQVYPLNLRMELFNAIWTGWRADIKEKDQQITDLQSQLAITEKALELACERVKYFEEIQDKEMGHFELFGYDSNYDLQAVIEQYKQQAKEMLENE